MRGLEYKFTKCFISRNFVFHLHVHVLPWLSSGTPKERNKECPILFLMARHLIAIALVSTQLLLTPNPRFCTLLGVIPLSALGEYQMRYAQMYVHGVVGNANWAVLCSQLQPTYLKCLEFHSDWVNDILLVNSSRRTLC